MLSSVKGEKVEVEERLDAQLTNLRRAGDCKGGRGRS